jgi:hypothetical protein
MLDGGVIICAPQVSLRDYFAVVMSRFSTAENSVRVAAAPMLAQEQVLSRQVRPRVQRQ